jgi:hypothetical protein
MSPSPNFSRRRKQFTLSIVMLFVAGTLITKAPRAAATAEAAFCEAQHLLDSADTDGREVRPIPLLG